MQIHPSQLPSFRLATLNHFSAISFGKEWVMRVIMRNLSTKVQKKTYSMTKEKRLEKKVSMSRRIVDANRLFLVY